MRPRLNRATRSVGRLSTALAVFGDRRVELALRSRICPRLLCASRVQRIQRERPPVGLRRLVPSLLQPQQHAVVVVRVGDVDAERDDGPVVLLGLGEVPRAAVERDQVGVRLRQRRVERQRRFVRGDGAVDVAGVRELDAALQQRAADRRAAR